MSDPSTNNTITDADFIPDKALERRLQANLAEFGPVALADNVLRRAAVAIVVCSLPENPGECSILLTRRPARLNQHAGQYALPGGKLDEGETLVEAAFRELNEELGLNLPIKNLLGVLDDYPTRSGFCITPVVIWAGPGCILTPAAAEVEEVFAIPLRELDSDAIPVFEAGVDPDRPVLCSEFPTLGHRMYSPTASMLYQFREVAIRGLDTRVSHFDQPRFAWK